MLSLSKRLVVNGGRALAGKTRASSSDLYTHTYVVISSLAEGVSTISSPLYSEDTAVTVSACRAMGATIEEKPDEMIVSGAEMLAMPREGLKLGHSENALGLLVPILTLLNGEISMSGDDKLLDEIKNIAKVVKSIKILNKKEGQVLLATSPISENRLRITRKTDSLAIPGLLIACAKSKADVELLLPAKNHRNQLARMTAEALKVFGVNALMEESKNRLFIPAPQKITAAKTTVEGSFLHAAYLSAAASISHSLTRIENVNPSSLQPERKILNLIEQFGCSVHPGENFVEIDATVESHNPINFDSSESFRLTPAAMVLACFSNRWSTISNVTKEEPLFKRLRLLLLELNRAGAETSMDNDNLYIRGGKLKNAKFSGHGDYLVGLACTSLALGIEGSSQIDFMDDTLKHIPGFLDSLTALGAEANIQDEQQQTLTNLSS